MNHFEVIRNWLETDKLTLIDVDTPSKKVMRVESEQGIFYLKQKSSTDEVNREIYYFEKLKENNVPISVPMMGKNQQYYYEYGGNIYCLYESLPGSTVENVQSRNQANACGEAISNLHKGLRMCSEVELNASRMDIKSQLKDWAMPVTLELEPKVAHIIEYLETHFFPIIDSLPQQMIHRDAHPRNMLFDDGLLSGFIDFDISTYGIRIFDPCYCSTAILMQDFNEQARRNQWFEIYSELIKGYQTGIQLTENEKNSLFPVLLSIQLIFIAYFKDIDVLISMLNVDGLLWLYDHRNYFEKSEY
jgi:Ser/Thr protein kinase RdoA (MazF antagonist)